jgi:hypothetical protein
MTTFLTLEFKKAPHGTVKAHREAIKSALEHMMLFQAQELMPRKFEPIAVMRYAFAKRSKAYQIAKARKHGHQRALEFSGDLKAAILGKPPTIRFRGNAVRASYGGAPKYLAMRGRNQNGPDKVAELQTLESTDGVDQQRMIDAMNKRYIEAMRASGHGAKQVA